LRFASKALLPILWHRGWLRLAARIPQSTTHLISTRNLAAILRFSFFGVLVAIEAL
jgi:hypothetical protein